VGPRPRTSRDYLAAACDVAAIRDWHAEFRKPGYRGNSFLDLEGFKRRPFLPSTHKGGPWLQEAGRELGVFTRLVRSITGHAPIGAYRRKFVPATTTPSRTSPWSTSLRGAQSTVASDTALRPALSGGGATSSGRTSSRSPLASPLCGIPDEGGARGDPTLI
jgi:hypothetical protein